MDSRARRLAEPPRPGRILLLAAVVAALGVSVLWSQRGAWTRFGWFAYAPITPEQLDSLVVVTGWTVIGGVLTSTGAVLLALVAGQVLARERRPPGLRRASVVIGLILLVGGCVALGLTTGPSDVGVTGIGGARSIGPPPSVTDLLAAAVLLLTDRQVAALAVAAAGAVVVGFAVGLRQRRR